ncbi:hypothetical protein Tco_0993204 [Tanacetum coccineum]|uniref:Uncharacterized protein n=1 Tax=Tanacetum coccineum TaxID=301880 RepID=A0ABQ5F4H3_9ASTR
MNPSIRHSLSPHKCIIPVFPLRCIAAGPTIFAEPIQVTQPPDPLQKYWSFDLPAWITIMGNPYRPVFYQKQRSLCQSAEGIEGPGIILHARLSGLKKSLGPIAGTQGRGYFTHSKFLFVGNNFFKGAWIQYRLAYQNRHLDAIKTFLSVLNGSINMGLWYTKGLMPMSLTAYADAVSGGMSGYETKFVRCKEKKPSLHLRQKPGVKAYAGKSQKLIVNIEDDSLDQ